jgi:electron transfer flavoprotein alpha/beta subunit
MGIRKAAKMAYPVWTLEEIGAEASRVGESGSGVRWPKVFEPPVREGEAEIIEGETIEEKAEKLVEKLLAEKVI